MLVKDKILKLKSEGKSPVEILAILSCSKSVVYYHFSDNYKSKRYKSHIKYRNNHKLSRKIEKFSWRFSKLSKPKLGLSNKRAIYFKIRTFSLMKKEYQKPLFTEKQVIDKFGTIFNCPLTGKKINLNEPDTYEFDHKIPRSRGGDNSIDNLQIITKEANQAKSNMTNEEFIKFCKLVVDNNTI